MNFSVIRFPGSNCDQDALWAVTRVLGHSGSYVWHKDTVLAPATDVVLVPGGFSYGDYLRAGAMAAVSPIMGAIRSFAEQGGPVLGICNGYQILAEARLLDGALTRNVSLKFSCRDVYVRVEGKPTLFTSAIPAGRILKLPIAHAEGRFVHPGVAALEAEGRVVFRYCDAAGGVDTAGANPNGSLHSIAGTSNARGNVVGLMPHPERACERILGSEDGRLLFESVIASLGKSRARVDLGARS